MEALRPGAFLQIGNVTNMATNASILLVLAVGSTFVIMTGGIDLSINGVRFSGVVAAMAMVAVEGPVTCSSTYLRNRRRRGLGPNERHPRGGPRFPR